MVCFAMIIQSHKVVVWKAGCGWRFRSRSFELKLQAATASQTWGRVTLACKHHLYDVNNEQDC